jgi:hypothetical protein
MSEAEHQAETSIEGLEYAISGGWTVAVWHLVRGLRKHGCGEYVCRLEPLVQAVPASGAPHAAEVAALVDVREELAFLYNTMPAQVAPQPRKELSDLRRRAARFVQYRLRQLASNSEAVNRATSDVAALLSQWRADDGPRVNHIRRTKLVWEISYGTEHEKFPAKDFTILPALAALLGRPAHPHEFETLVDPQTAQVLAASRTKSDRLDRQAVAEIKAKYDELQQDAAKETNPAIKQEIEAEKAQLLAELKAASGPGGRKRKLGRTPRDQAWDAMTKALRRLPDRLREAGMPELAAHLSQYIKVDRPQITYLPPESTLRWVVET